MWALGASADWSGGGCLASYRGVVVIGGRGRDLGVDTAHTCSVVSHEPTV